jgi:hypothetical protein
LGVVDVEPAGQTPLEEGLPEAVLETPEVLLEVELGVRDQARGVGANIVPDAHLATPAIESRSLWITTERDDGRLAGLCGRHPLGGDPLLAGPTFW